MVIEAGAFIVDRPPRRWLLSVTPELSTSRILSAAPTTDGETQTHRWSHSSHRFARRVASPRASETERGAHRDHRRVAGVHGLDDLGVVDDLQVDRGDPEVVVTQLALDDDERHALVSHLDGV